METNCSSTKGICVQVWTSWKDLQHTMSCKPVQLVHTHSHLHGDTESNCQTNTLLLVTLSNLSTLTNKLRKRLLHMVVQNVISTPTSNIL